MIRFRELGLRERSGFVLAPFAFLGAGLGLSGSLGCSARWALGSALGMAILWITESIPLWATALLPLILFPDFGAAKWTSVSFGYRAGRR